MQLILSENDPTTNEGPWSIIWQIDKIFHFGPFPCCIALDCLRSWKLDFKMSGPKMTTLMHSVIIPSFLWNTSQERCSASWNDSDKTALKFDGKCIYSSNSRGTLRKLGQSLGYIMTCVTRKQTLRSLSLSYPKKDWRGPSLPILLWVWQRQRP